MIEHVYLFRPLNPPLFIVAHLYLLVSTLVYYYLSRVYRNSFADVFSLLLFYHQFKFLAFPVDHGDRRCRVVESDLGPGVAVNLELHTQSPLQVVIIQVHRLALMQRHFFIRQ